MTTTKPNKKTRSPRHLRALGKSLPVGFTKMVYDRLNGKYHVTLITKVKRGHRHNDEIMNALLDVAEAHQAQLREQRQRAMKLTKMDDAA